MPGPFGATNSDDGADAFTESSAKTGVFGRNDSTAAAPADSVGGNGVFGLSTVPNASGVFGANNNGGIGVAGNSDKGDGMRATTASSANSGIFAANNATAAAPAGSVGGNGVFGLSTVSNAAGVLGANNSGGKGIAGVSNNGIGVYGIGKIAGHFEGNVEVTGDISLTNQDCAEDFDISRVDEIEPGTVMVIEKESALQVSECAYDRRVAGVISGAGNFKAGIILGKQQSQSKRVPIALLGKVYCKVDAGYSPIEIGDLLTTSPTPGHAMKVTDPPKALGAIIGKALRPLENGVGLIPILVALQ